ncbi:MAG: DMT family transporter [Bdellovibrionaceae bacterium]|nr:DMT family transporter [Bdellovibrio sp.]
MPHILLYFLALMSLSTSPVWAKLNLMPVEVLGFWRLGLASIIMGVWIIIYKRKTWPRIDRHFYWIILSGFFFFLHLWTYKYASRNTSVANTMILFASNPLWSSVGAIIFFKEKMTVRLMFAYVLAICGIYLLAFKHIEFNSKTFLGDISAVISAFFHACYMLTGKKSRLHYDNSIYAFFQYLVCAIFFAGFVFAKGQPVLGYNSISWLSVVGLVILPTLLGHLTLSYLVNYMSLSLMSCGKLLEPIMASIIAYFVFTETLKPQAWMAFTLTAFSVVILFWPSLMQLNWRRTTKPRPSDEA